MSLDLNKLKKLPYPFLAGFILMGIYMGTRPDGYTHKVEPATLFEYPDSIIKKARERKYSKPTKLVRSGPLSLEDSIKEMANRLGKPIYQYIMETEIIPQNQIYSISKSGYQQYEVERRGVGYSKTTVRFFTPKQFSSMEEAIKYGEAHPELWIPVSSYRKPEEKKTIPLNREIDYYDDMLDEYLSDPENEIDFIPEIFDFQDN